MWPHSGSSCPFARHFVTPGAGSQAGCATQRPGRFLGYCALQSPVCTGNSPEGAGSSRWARGTWPHCSTHGRAQGGPMGLGQGRRLGQARADAILALAGSAAELLRERQEGNCCAPVALQHPAGMLPPAQVCPHPARAADAAGSPWRGISGAPLGEQGLCTALPLPLLLCCVPAWLRVQPRDFPVDFLSPCSTWGVTPCLGGWHIPTHMHLGFTAGEVWGIWGNLGVFLVLLSPVQGCWGGGAKPPAGHCGMCWCRGASCRGTPLSPSGTCGMSPAPPFPWQQRWHPEHLEQSSPASRDVISRCPGNPASAAGRAVRGAPGTATPTWGEGRGVRAEG